MNPTGSRDSAARRIGLDAVLLGAALILSYVEHLIPLGVPLPGFKPGLANIAVMLAFFRISPRDAALISFARILIMAALFGSAGSLIFSLSGGAAAYLSLILSSLAARRLSYIGISAIAACAHNFGQTCAAAVIFGAPGILGYLPMITAGGVVFGTICGIIMNISAVRLVKFGFGNGGKQ